MTQKSGHTKNKPRNSRGENGIHGKGVSDSTKEHPENKHLLRMRAWQKHLSEGVMHVTVYVNPLGKHFDRVIQAIWVINSAQTYYRLKFELDEKGEILATDDRVRSAEDLRRKINQRFQDSLVIAMTEHDLTEEESEVTMSEAPGCTIISCDDWIEFDDAPPTRVYLVYQLTSAITTFSACLTVAENDMMMHQGEEDNEGEEDDDEIDFLKGCLFDYWVGAKLLYRSMVSARLCPKCRSALLAHGAPSEAVNATEKLLDWVRSVILERERKLPRKVFIGHGGKSSAWQELREMLHDWGLEVEEFNEEPAAGISITQRLKSMLENSRFAFLVMTGENIDGQGHLQARMNVIHEIGLFQGRLGTECAIVLRERNTSTFSNLDGINRIDFDQDKITGLREEIHRLLITRGVIPADIPLKNDLMF
jgi:hypothetical protein